MSLTEDRFGSGALREASGLDPHQAYRETEAQLLRLNPLAQLKKLERFILGRRPASKRVRKRPAGGKKIE